MIILLSILLVVLLIFNFFTNESKKEYFDSWQNAVKTNKSLNKKIEENRLEYNTTIDKLLNDNNSLSKFRHLVDIDAASEQMINNAKSEQISILRDAKIFLSDAQKELEKAKYSALEIRKKAEQEILLKISKAERSIEIKEASASKLIEEAQNQALKIAGEAYYALENHKELESAIKAMKNIIDGYGDSYIVPIYSIIDQIGTELSYSEAGQMLKESREKSRLMIINNLAATCGYAENNRRTTAIRFVLDAFNGKVDSILSEATKDNFGLLEQKLNDAFKIVNTNGVAFRDAKIRSTYLNARIDELKWACIALQLKYEKQEEQRLIREQMREEEKARREIEKALKDAQKEEESLKKLIEKAQKEVQNANDEQRRKFEDKLFELEAKLLLAEEKNKRALSMAQQTKSGNVYIISNIGSFGEDVFKIGMTRRLEPLDRVKELGDASVPFEFDVHAMLFSNDAPALERELHKKFITNQVNKVNYRKEFFKVSINQIKDTIDELGIQTSWTMEAIASQYRETLKIEKSFEDEIIKLEWENHQLMLDPVVDEELSEIE